MSAIKFELQKEVFEASKERLHGVVTVTSSARRKKPPGYLCITGTIEKPIRFTLYQIKKTEKGFKRKQEWTLSTLKQANYKSGETTEFELQLDKSYQWTAASMEEKDAFFSLLHQICARLNRSPKFVNYQVQEGSNGLLPGSDVPIVAVPKDSTITESDEDDFGLTDREEADLEKVLTRAEGAVVNAEAFMEQLAKELSILDGENIHSIMESETQVNDLMESINLSVSALEDVEAELQAYEDAVIQVKVAVEKIEEENAQMGTAAKNNHLLLEELTRLIQSLDFSAGSVVLNPDFNSLDGIQKVTEAVYSLKDALTADQDDFHPTLLRMQAVVDQKRRLEKYKTRFADSLKSHLEKLFVHYGNFSSIDVMSSIQLFRLPQLQQMHKELLPYCELTGWLKVMDADGFNRLLQTYTNSMQKVYEKNIKALFEEARSRISGAGGGGVAASRMVTSSSTGDLRVRGRYFGKTRVLAHRDGDNESQGSGEGSVDSSERQDFYDVLEQLLEGLEPAVNSEEKFIASFFHITTILSTPSPTSPTRNSSVEIRRLMTIMFGSIEAEMVGFLTQYEKLESSFCMGAMVRLGNHTLKPENASTFISMIFGSVLIQEKRSFDRLMNAYVEAINNSRLPRKAKPGIIAFVTDFEDFALMSEIIFAGSNRRDYLEKAYARMLTAIFDGINRLSSEGSSKIPGEVIRMENFHRLHANLSKLKVAHLEQQKRDAKAKYTDALNAYVTKHFGRPLIKLNEFFDGIQGRVSQGVKESEIGYQMAYSRTELKRVIKEYPAKEVKKGLDSLYKKVEKHLSEEENLLQVVWRAMQEEFIVQYKSIESLIGRCYPGAKITLEFTIDDILIFFSEIAQSH